MQKDNFLYCDNCNNPAKYFTYSSNVHVCDGDECLLKVARDEFIDGEIEQKWTKLISQ